MTGVHSSVRYASTYLLTSMCTSVWSWWL